MTSSPTALHLHRLSLRLSPPTSLAQDPEAWRDQATALRRTKGSRTWFPTQRLPAQTQAYQAPCSLSLEKLMEVDLVLLSPWLVTPVIALQCPTKAKRWERAPPGEGQTPGALPALDIGLLHSGDKWRKSWSERSSCISHGGRFWTHRLIFTSDGPELASNRRSNNRSPLVSPKHIPSWIKGLGLKLFFFSFKTVFQLHATKTLPSNTLARNAKGDIFSSLSFWTHD